MKPSAAYIAESRKFGLTAKAKRWDGKSEEERKMQLAWPGFCSHLKKGRLLAEAWLIKVHGVEVAQDLIRQWMLDPKRRARIQSS